MHDIALMLVRLVKFLKTFILNFKHSYLVQKGRFIGKTKVKFAKFKSLYHVNALRSFINVLFTKCHIHPNANLLDSFSSLF